MGAEGNRPASHQRHRSWGQDPPDRRRAQGVRELANFPLQERMGVLLQEQARQARDALQRDCRLVRRPHADAARQVLHHVPLPRVPVFPRQHPHQECQPVRDARLRHGFHERRARHGSDGVGLRQVSRDGQAHGCVRWRGREHGKLPPPLHGNLDTPRSQLSNSTLSSTTTRQPVATTWTWPPPKPMLCPAT